MVVVTERDRSRARARRLSTWAQWTAVTLTAVGICELVHWGDRAWIAHRVARMAGADPTYWPVAYSVLNGAQVALVRAVVLLCLAALIAALVRRRSPRL